MRLVDGCLWESYDFGAVLLAVMRFKYYSLISIDYRLGIRTFMVAVIFGGMGECKERMEEGGGVCLRRGHEFFGHWGICLRDK